MPPRLRRRRRDAVQPTRRSRRLRGLPPLVPCAPRVIAPRGVSAVVPTVSHRCRHVPEPSAVVVPALPTPAPPGWPGLSSDVGTAASFGPVPPSVQVVPPPILSRLREEVGAATGPVPINTLRLRGREVPVYTQLPRRRRSRGALTPPPIWT